MAGTVLIIGNGFDMDLGINLSFKSYRSSHYCLAYELDKLNPKGDKWNDFERELRKCILEYEDYSSNPENRAKDINLFWQGFWKYFSAFFTETTEKYPTELQVEENCAFEVLRAITTETEVFTFNYTYPYEYTQIEPKNVFKFIHGRYYKDSFSDNMLIMSQSQNMILGIDCSRIPEKIKVNEYFRPIIKQYNQSFIETNVREALNEAQNIIFFGHGLGICDSDYFEHFFNNIENGNAKCKTIYIVTYKEIDFEEIKKSTLEWGVNLNNLKFNGVSLIPVYTSLGNEQQSFIDMLKLL